MSEERNALSLVKTQLTQLEQLEAIIDAEKEVLQKQSPDKLTEISSQKNELLVAIQNLDKQFSENAQFIEDKANGLFSEELKLIETTLLRCKEKNHVNGQIIAQSQLAVERMKTSLLQNHNKSSMTYDNKGKTSGGLSSLGIKA